MRGATFVHFILGCCCARLVAASSAQSVHDVKIHPLGTGFTLEWPGTGDRELGQIEGYSVQYRDAYGREDEWTDGLDGHNDGHCWQVGVKVDGYNRRSGRTHTVGDGWWTLALTWTPPHPSNLQLLKVVTAQLAWDSPWYRVKKGVEDALRSATGSGYEHWTADVVRNDEVADMNALGEGAAWLKEWPYLALGGYMWHIRLKPPAGGDAKGPSFPPPTVSLEQETITGQWTGSGPQVEVGVWKGWIDLNATKPGVEVEGLTAGVLLDPMLTCRAVGKEDGPGLEAPHAVCQTEVAVGSPDSSQLRNYYAFRVRALNDAGWGDWSDVTATQVAPAHPDPPPSQPTVPVLSSRSNKTAFTVSVATMPDDDVEAYAFELQKDGQPNWTHMEDVQVDRTLLSSSPGAPTVSLTLKDLDYDSGYRVRVRARSAGSYGPYSAPSRLVWTHSKEPPAPSSAPFVDGQLGISATSMDVQWADDNYAASLNDDQPDGGARIVSYELQYQALGSPAGWRPAGSVPVTLAEGVKGDSNSLPAAWSLEVEGLSPYTRYKFRVRSLNAQGPSAWSDESPWYRTFPLLPLSTTSFAGSGGVDEPRGTDGVGHDIETPSAPQAVFANSTAVTVVIEWGTLATLGAPRGLFELEVAEGWDGAQFALVYSGSITEEYNPPRAHTLSDTKLAAVPPLSQQQLYRTITGLQADTAYRVRVRYRPAVGGYWSAYSEATRVITESVPRNEWSLIHPRVVRRARGGSGLSAPVMGRPHLDPQAEVWNETARADAHQWSDPGDGLPDGLSGHSMVTINGVVYMFGGVSGGHTCSGAISDTSDLGDNPTGVFNRRKVDACVANAGRTNRLWRYEPAVQRWTEVAVGDEGGLPAPREGHSAAAISGGRMLVFGGRSAASEGSAGEELLNDLWEIDLEPTETVTVASAASTTLKPSGVTLATLNVTADDVTSAGGSAGSGGDGMCIVDVSVELHITHPCPQRLEVVLYGPGPSTRDANFRPSSRDYPVTLLRPTNPYVVGGFAHVNAQGSRTFESGDGGGYYSCPDEGNLGAIGPGCVLSDDGEAREAGAGKPICGRGGGGRGGGGGGAQRPFESLAAFKRAPVQGEWTLGVLDPSSVRASAAFAPNDSDSGTLQSWGLTILVEPCGGDSALRWVNRTTDDLSEAWPAPRAGHTVAVVKDGRGMNASSSMFVWGGRGNNSNPASVAFDLWRLDGIADDGVDTAWGGSWTQLRSASSIGIEVGRTGISLPLKAVVSSGQLDDASLRPPAVSSASLVLTPLGLLAIGGGDRDRTVLQRRGTIRTDKARGGGGDGDGNDGYGGLGGAGQSSRRADGGDGTRVWLRDMVSREWNILHMSTEYRRGVQPHFHRHEGGERGKLYPRLFDTEAPQLKYGASVTLVSVNGDKEAVQLVMYGGMGDVFERAPELWTLNLRNVSTVWVNTLDRGRVGMKGQVQESASVWEAQREGYCAHQLGSGTANRTWYEGCMGIADGQCAASDVVLRAWCMGDYQPLGSIGWSR